MPGEQILRCLGVDASLAQSRVEATPAAAVDSREAQVHGRGNCTSGKDSVAEFKQSLGATIKACVKLLTKCPNAVQGSQSIVQVTVSDVVHQDQAVEREISCTSKISRISM
jgi:hypothetical protein